MTLGAHPCEVKVVIYPPKYLGRFNTNYIIFKKCWNFEKLLLPHQEIVVKGNNSEYLGIFHWLNDFFQNKLFIFNEHVLKWPKGTTIFKLTIICHGKSANHVSSYQVSTKLYNKFFIPHFPIQVKY
jgi:hypothetical protein